MSDKTYYELLLEENEDELAIQKEIDEEIDAYENTDAYKDHLKKLKELWALKNDATKKRMAEAKTLKSERVHRKSVDMTKIMSEIEDRHKKTIDGLPEAMKSIYNAFAELSDDEKSKLIKLLGRISPNEDMPREIDDVTLTDDDLVKLHAALAQTCIDFISDADHAREIDAVGFYIDGLKACADAGMWVSDSDTSLRVYGCDGEHGEYLIGERMC